MSYRLPTRPTTSTLPLPSLPLKPRSSPSSLDLFPYLSLVRAVIPPNMTHTGPETLPGIQQAVVPLGYGKNIYLPEHKGEIEGKEREMGQRSASSTKRGVKGRKTGIVETMDHGSFRSSLRTPFNRISRNRYIPGFLYLPNDETAYFSQSSKANLSTNTTKRTESPMLLSKGLREVTMSPVRKSPSPTKRRVQGDDRSIKTYEGEQHNSVKHGKGTAVYGNGDVYSGYWYADKRHGQGRYTSKAWKTVFVGEWKEDRRSGEGVLNFENGDVLEGRWGEDGLEEREVRVRFVQSEVLYTGSLQSSQFHGLGTCLFSRDQVTYTGHWLQGQRHGLGCLYFPENHFFEGVFQTGYSHGPGLLVYRNALMLRDPQFTLRKSKKTRILEENPGKTLGNCSFFPTFTSKITLNSTDIVWKTSTKSELESLGCDLPVTDGSFVLGKLQG